MNIYNVYNDGQRVQHGILKRYTRQNQGTKSNNDGGTYKLIMKKIVIHQSKLFVIRSNFTFYQEQVIMKTRLILILDPYSILKISSWPFFFQCLEHC